MGLSIEYSSRKLVSLVKDDRTSNFIECNIKKSYNKQKKPDFSVICGFSGWDIEKKIFIV
jgi:hypothetical protein